MNLPPCPPTCFISPLYYCFCFGFYSRSHSFEVSQLIFLIPVWSPFCFIFHIAAEVLILMWKSNDVIFPALLPLKSNDLHSSEWLVLAFLRLHRDPHSQVSLMSQLCELLLLPSCALLVLNFKPCAWCLPLILSPSLFFPSLSYFLSLRWEHGSFKGPSSTHRGQVSTAYAPNSPALFSHDTCSCAGFAHLLV